MLSSNGEAKEELRRLSTFELSGNIFGVDISQMNEVIPLPQFTPLPNCNEIYLGVFNLRGEIYPIVDLAPLFEIRPKKLKLNDMVILLNHFSWVIGMRTDKILSMISYNTNQILDSKGLVSRSFSQYLNGHLNYKSREIYILDLDSIFRAPKIIAYS